MTDTNSENRTGFAAAFLERWRGYKLPFIATLLFGLAAHAFAMTNKLPFDDEAIYLFGKGTTTASGRYGLELLRLKCPIIPCRGYTGLFRSCSSPPPCAL